MKFNKRFTVYMLLSVGILLCSVLIYKTVLGFKKVQNPYHSNSYTLCFDTLHTLCGHKDRFVYPEEQTVNNFDVLKKQFPEWNIRKEPDKIILSRTIKDYCDLHYFAHLVGDTVRVTYRDGTLKDAFSIADLSLSDQELLWLKNGVYLDGKEALNAFMEDFNS